LTALSWYGEHNRLLQVASETALWYHSGMPVIALRWALIRDPLGQFDTQALLCTDVHAAPAFIFDFFVQRWQMEVTFEEARAHLSVETQRQSSDKAIARTTPCLLGLYSIVTLLAQPLFTTGQLSVHGASWYPKPQATFFGTIAAVRRWLWRHEHFSTSLYEPDMIKNTAASIGSLYSFALLCRANGRSRAKLIEANQIRCITSLQSVCNVETVSVE
jgi:hypothetical protein